MNFFTSHRNVSLKSLVYKWCWFMMSPKMCFFCDQGAHKSCDKINNTKTYLYHKFYYHTIFLVEVRGGYITPNLQILLRAKVCTKMNSVADTKIYKRCLCEKQNEKYKNAINFSWFDGLFEILKLML